MNAPINFAERVAGHLFSTGNGEYKMSDNLGADNKIWIFPNWKSYNVILMEFDWGRETYTVKVVARGQYANFHNILPPQPILEKELFQTFFDFETWMKSRMIELYELL